MLDIFFVPIYRGALCLLLRHKYLRRTHHATYFSYFTLIVVSNENVECSLCIFKCLTRTFFSLDLQTLCVKRNVNSAPTKIV